MAEKRLALRRANGSLIQLIEFLDIIDGADLHWTLFDFDIFGPAPEGMDLEAFEAMTWSDAGDDVMG